MCIRDRYMLLYTCTSTCTYCVRLSVCLSTCVIMFKYVWVCDMCTVACFSNSDPFGEIRTVAGDPDPIRIRDRCGPDTMAIRRPIHGMIRRSVQVRAVKTRRWFGSETASFHMSVCSYVIFFLPLLCFICIISCDFILYFIRLTTVSLHETLLIVHLKGVIGISLY